MAHTTQHPRGGLVGSGQTQINRALFAQLLRQGQNIRSPAELGIRLLAQALQGRTLGQSQAADVARGEARQGASREALGRVLAPVTGTEVVEGPRPDIAGFQGPLPGVSQPTSREALAAELIGRIPGETQLLPDDRKLALGIATARRAAAPKPRRAASKLGKQLEDIQLFGPDTPQGQAIQEAIDSEGAGEAPKLTDVGGIRKEFTKLSGPFIKVRDALGRIKSSDPTAAGDFSLIFNFLKVLDPGSTVREGEFAAVGRAGGLPDIVQNAFNKLTTGQILTKKQRADFRKQADNLFAQQERAQAALSKQFTDLAIRQGIDPANVVIDFSVELPEQASAAPAAPPLATAPIRAPAAQPGQPAAQTPLPPAAQVAPPVVTPAQLPVQDLPTLSDDDFQRQLEAIRRTTEETNRAVEAAKREVERSRQQLANPSQGLQQSGFPGRRRRTR